MICMDDTPNGFILFDVVSSEYAIVYSDKANLAVKGVYEALLWCTAKMLSGLGLKYIYFEQDKGIENLRHSKNEVQQAAVSPEKTCCYM